MIKVKNVIHRYLTKERKELVALKDINLEIREGEFVVIIGHNGSGKTTLAKLFNALLLPSEGEVWVDGINTKDLERIWEIRQRVGMVFQNPDNQIVATIVEEDVAFGLENLGIPSLEIRRRVDEALNVVRMSEYVKHAPHLLSGGQKQRVAIAGVIAMKPKYIVLDEPTSLLDPQGREEVLETVKRLNREEGITIVHITHFMEEAIVADKVIGMSNGQIVIEGEPRQVFTRVERLKELGLEVPPMTELAYHLRSKGLSIPEGILTIDELAEIL